MILNVLNTIKNNKIKALGIAVCVGTLYARRKFLLAGAGKALHGISAVAPLLPSTLTIAVVIAVIAAAIFATQKILQARKKADKSFDLRLLSGETTRKLFDGIKALASEMVNNCRKIENPLENVSQETRDYGICINIANDIMQGKHPGSIKKLSITALQALYKKVWAIIADVDVSSDKKVLGALQRYIVEQINR